MNELQFLRYSLIESVMKTTDVEKLRFLYGKVEQQDSPATPKIPVAEIRSEVLLKDITGRQVVRRSSFEEHMKEVGQEKWEVSLIDTLALLD